MIKKILKTVFSNKQEIKPPSSRILHVVLVDEYDRLLKECGMGNDYKGAGTILRYVGKKFLGEDFITRLPGPKMDLCRYLAIENPDYFKKLADLWLKHGKDDFVMAIKD